MSNEGLVGSYLGRYKVEELVGRGGMAEVYRATQVNLDRFVAIKVMHRFLSDDRDFLNRFEREARVMAKIRHPNIVHVHDYEVEDDYYYIVMDYLSGGTLKNLLDRMAMEGGVIDLARASQVTLEIGEALAYAHNVGMVHRDIKPANIMFDEKGIAVLTDFGIARMVGGTTHTTTGSMIGTPAYMSPEQGLGESGDERSDIYSLGVLAYHLFTGRLPFEGDTPLSVVLKHVNENPPYPTSINPDIPTSLEKIVLKAMDKNPDNRWRSVLEMNQEIKIAMKNFNSGGEVEFQSSLGTQDHPTPIPSLTVPNSEHDSLAYRIGKEEVTNNFLDESATMLTSSPFRDNALEFAMPENEAYKNESAEHAAPIENLPEHSFESKNLLPDLEMPVEAAPSIGHEQPVNRMAAPPIRREAAGGRMAPPPQNRYNDAPTPPQPQNRYNDAPAQQPAYQPPQQEPNYQPQPEPAQPPPQFEEPEQFNIYEAIEDQRKQENEAPVARTAEEVQQDEAYNSEMAGFLKGFSKKANKNAKLKVEINPLKKKENRRKRQRKIGGVMKGVLTIFFVLAGIIFGILYVTRFAPSIDLEGIINDQLDNPDISEVDLSGITAENLVATSAYTRATLNETGMILSIPNRTSVPLRWIGSLEYIELSDDEASIQTWNPVNGKQVAFDSNGEIAFPVDGSFPTNAQFRWVVYSSESLTDIIGTSEPFDLPTADGDILDVEINVN